MAYEAFQFILRELICIYFSFIKICIILSPFSGLHLNLTEGTTLTNATSLLGNDGYMLGKHGFRDKLRLGIDLLQVSIKMVLCSI